MKQTSTAWYYQDKELELDQIPEGSIGFVYLIEHKTTGRKYIGKKSLYVNKISVKTVLIKSGPNKGQKKKKKTKTPVYSDWQTYYGSSELLKTEVDQQGTEMYLRTILQFCASKSQMSYVETKEQFVRDVLLSDEYYNSWITCKIHKAHVLNKI
jgi:hypothetical protein